MRLRICLYIDLVAVTRVNETKFLPSSLQRKQNLEFEDADIPVVLLANKVSTNMRMELGQFLGFWLFWIDPPSLFLKQNEGRHLGPKDTQRLDSMCREHGFQAWFPTSAKTGQNVQMAFSFLAVRAVDKSIDKN